MPHSVLLETFPRDLLEGRGEKINGRAYSPGARGIEKDYRALVTVLVCTHRRPALLRQCIESLLAMAVPEGLKWELVCVDNNSNDDTKRTVEELAARSIMPIRYLLEPTPGKGYAVNRGFAHARGSIIAMIDEDCVVARDWLAAIWREFQAAPRLDMIGGRLELHDPNAIRIAIRTFKERIPYHDDSLFNLVPGCNLAFRRAVIDVVGEFDAEFGPGGPTGGAEDSDFIYRAALAGLRIEYTPDVLVYHDHGHYTAQDLLKKQRQYMIARGVLYAKYMFRADRRITKMVYWETAKLLKGALKQIFKRGAGQSELRYIRWLVVGFWRYFLARLQGLFARRRNSPSVRRPFHPSPN
jgi:glycosyltransferase involved in cell wall biosynthesis